jgi:AcrR family transcriptional regulator
MPRRRPARVVRRVRPARKRAGAYHHGDLRRALLQEALRTIQADGVQAVTLRAVGAAVGVSRTALYRHFADKGALLTAVAAEGFRMLRESLVEAWERGGRRREGFDEMGVAYVRFAVAHPSHYRVMFGGIVNASANADLTREASGAFQSLVDALVALQQQQLAKPDDPLQLARFVWALVHGIAMLAIDGQLGPRADPDALARFAIARVHTGI